MGIISWFVSGPLPPGSIAPDFTLPDQSGAEVSLSGLRGRNVVLVFYPRDESPGCRKQLCEFRDEWASVISKDAMLFGVNPQDASAHASFMSRHQFPFSLLIDKGQKVAKAYLCGGLIVRRTVYVIGKDGRIVFSRRGKPSAQEVLSSIA